MRDFSRWTSRALALVALLSLLHRPAWSEEESGSDTPEQPAAAEEAEERGVIPPTGAVASSATLVTPITTYVEKSAYELAMEQLTHATDLWNKGLVEAASDAALEAYDDLVNLHRVRHVKRSKLRKQRHQAASLYVIAGIATIRTFVKEHGRTAAALTEGRERLEDLRDVSKEYPDLNRLVSVAKTELK